MKSLLSNETKILSSEFFSQFKIDLKSGEILFISTLCKKNMFNGT
jgi:hypothetical protein